MTSLAELCSRLSISTATGKNWIKLGKIIPDCIKDNNFYFSEETIKAITSNLNSSEGKLLKSRRNKKYISGNFLYKDYISKESKNIDSVMELLTCLENTSPEPEHITLFIAEAALQFYYQKKYSVYKTGLLAEYLENNSQSPFIDFLIDDIIFDKKKALDFINTNPLLFSIQFFYENTEDILGLIYISCVSMNSRKATGAYYTPKSIVKKLIGNLEASSKIYSLDICDPCCGTGNFLLQLPNTIPLDKLYAFDLNETALKTARINLALKYDCYSKELLYKNFQVKNFLESNTEKKYGVFIGNPPWGYDFSQTEKTFLKNKYKCTSGKNIESYDVFIEQALLSTEPKGIVSFVLPEAILNVKTHKSIRKLILQQTSIQYLEYLGNPFDKVQCPSIILQLIHTEKKLSTINTKIKTHTKSFTIKKERCISAEAFAFNTTDIEYDLLNKLNSLPGKQVLLGNADFALGIVTGDNERFISTTKTDVNEPILKGNDIFKYNISKTDNFITFKPENFQQVAPTQFYRQKEKLLYRFICNQLVFAYDNEQNLSLNSCNILIPKIKDLDIKYVLAILNSRIAQFYFAKSFTSVKVLRSHIEQIPIPSAEPSEQNTVIKLVNQILGETDTNILMQTYNCLDEYICHLYKLSDSDYELIKKEQINDNIFLFKK